MDRRIGKTQKNLKDNLIKILLKKDIHQVTVTELAAAANVNRGTFYLHYVDIYDMIDKIQSDQIDFIKEVVDKYKDDYKNNVYMPLLMDLAKHIKSEIRLYKVLLGVRGTMNFVSRFKNELEEIFLSMNNPLLVEYDQEVLSAAASFVIMGSIGVFQDWVNGNCEGSPEKIVKTLQQIFMSGVHYA